MMPSLFRSAIQSAFSATVSGPAIEITSAESDPSKDSPFTVTFTFSEDVTGFAVGDISVVNGLAGGFVTINAHIYTAAITPAIAGLVGVNVAANVCTSVANGLGNSAGSFSITFVRVGEPIGLLFGLTYA